MARAFLLFYKFIGSSGPLLNNLFLLAVILDANKLGFCPIFLIVFINLISVKNLKNLLNITSQEFPIYLQNIPLTERTYD